MKTESSNIEERKLLSAISQGDIAAFEQIFFEYQPRLIYFLNGFIRNTEEAHDFAQDIFLSLWEKRAKLAEVDNFSSYLLKIAKCIVYNYYDHIAVEEKYITEYLYNHTAEYISDEEKFFAKELAQRIDSAMETLSPQQRKIYIMSRKEGIPNNEIALRLNINKRTVENHLSIALSILRKVIISFLCIYIS